MVNGYTTVEQSKRLVELGLDPSTADMWWSRCTITDFGDNDLKVSYAVTPCNISQFKNTDKDIPCWSLTALLELMPPYLFEFERGIDLNIYRNLNGKGWHVSYMPNNINDMKKDKFRQITNGNLIDAAFEMICWLIEQKRI